MRGEGRMERRGFDGTQRTACLSSSPRVDPAAEEAYPLRYRARANFASIPSISSNVDPATTIFPSGWIANPRAKSNPLLNLVVALPLPPNDVSREPSHRYRARANRAAAPLYPALPAATIFPLAWIATSLAASSSRVNLEMTLPSPSNVASAFVERFARAGDGGDRPSRADRRGATRRVRRRARASLPESRPRPGHGAVRGRPAPGFLRRGRERHQPAHRGGARDPRGG